MQPLVRLSGPFPPVLDVCCGPRGMWFNKHDERAMFTDKRRELVEMDCPSGKYKYDINPDIVADVACLPFPSDTFFHVVFDPPHCKGTECRRRGLNGRHYGLLFDGWRDMLRKGFAECFRVLRPGGTLVFKWNEQEIPVREILMLTPEKPLYGHKSGKRAKTHWIAFLKPNSVLGRSHPSTVTERQDQGHDAGKMVKKPLDGDRAVG